MYSCLTVDDSKTQRGLVKKIAESCGLQVSTAPDGKSALEFCENEIPDIIILDMEMPNMSGIEFLQELDALPKERTPFIIVCSAIVKTDDIVKAVKMGADEYHCKSTNVDNLRKKIYTAIEHCENN